MISKTRPLFPKTNQNSQNKNKKIVILILFLFLIFGYWFYLLENKSHLNDSLNIDQLMTTKGIHDLSAINTQEFYSYLKDLSDNPEPFSYHVSGVVIPHHLLAGSMIAYLLKRVSSQAPKTIVLIGPNHFEKGTKPVLTSHYSWQTPFGILKPNTELISKLQNNDFIGVEESILVNEHAITGTVSFINYFMPNTTFVPLIISHRISYGEIEQMAEDLYSLVDINTLLILSVDFSHYLNSEQAQKRDAISLKEIQDFDLEKIALFSNEYVDSPKALILFLKIMQLKGTQNVEVIDHTNSGILTNNPYSENTSYFTLVFH